MANMNLSEVTFTDGKIQSFESIPNGVVMRFLDYANNTLEIEFSGNVSFQADDRLGFDLADYRLITAGNHYKLELFDDESLVFTIDFDSASYRFIDIESK